MTRGVKAALAPPLILIAGILAGGASPASLAATETIRPAAADDFRAAYATPQDIAEGRRLADASCARCHGPSGISAAKGVPHLAGQRAVYLHIELQAYKSGARGKNMMADAAKFLRTPWSRWRRTMPASIPPNLHRRQSPRAPRRDLIR
jgi:cytochrome c553